MVTIIISFIITIVIMDAIITSVSVNAIAILIHQI